MTFISEKVIETKQCKHCDTKFEITDKDIEFYEKVSPVFAWKKYLIPSPTLCPDCRFQNRQSFINERHLYKRKSDATWKEIISNYSPDKPYKVFESEIWLASNDFDKYGKEFDFSKSFFEQYNELFLQVPRMSLDQWANIESSSYNNYVDDLKDCYMCFNAVWAKSCYHTSYNFNSNDCVDCLISHDNIESYELVSCKKWYKLYFSQNCESCSESYFLKDCINCKDCMFCVNLSWKQYCIFNIQYSKLEYNTKKLELIKELQINKQKSINNFQEFKEKNIVKNLNIVNSEYCTWDEIINSKNIKQSFLVSDSENVAYSFNAVEAINCYDCDGFWIEKSYYNLVTWGRSQNCLFCIAWWENCSNLIYSDYCFFNCSNLFWCIWLKNKSYCILNKQYTKEEYEILVPKIIEHMIEEWDPTSPRFRGIWWWEFFPSSISPFWYNETVAQEYFPLTKEESEKKWFNWSTYETAFPNVDKIIPANMLPENIADIPDDILNWAIESELESTEGFSPLYRIIKQELEFYRKHNLPIPKRHPNQRHLDRMNLRNPRKIYERKCDKCGIDINTTYSPDRKELVYCKECYEKEVY